MKNHMSHDHPKLSISTKKNTFFGKKSCKFENQKHFAVCKNTRVNRHIVKQMLK